VLYYTTAAPARGELHCELHWSGPSFGRTCMSATLTSMFCVAPYLGARVRRFGVQMGLAPNLGARVCRLLWRPCSVLPLIWAHVYVALACRWVLPLFRAHVYRLLWRPCFVLPLIWARVYVALACRWVLPLCRAHAYRLLWHPCFVL